MEEHVGITIGRRAFIQSVVILLILMIGAGLLTIFLPSGSFARSPESSANSISAEAFSWTEKPQYPVWRWFTAPLEVLGSADAPVIITIIVFILIVGGAFAVMEASGVLHDTLAAIVDRFGERKYLLLLLVTFFFMFLGAFFGLFEEVVPLVPLLIALSYSLGWDALVGLGMSILATNVGFSAAITNPFTIGVAQKMAGLPLFSGAWLRVIIFIVFYVLLAFFLYRYARRIDHNPEASLVFDQDAEERRKFRAEAGSAFSGSGMATGRAAVWVAGTLALMLFVLLAAPFVAGLSDVTLPLVGMLFLAAGTGAGLLAGMTLIKVGKTFVQGVGGIAAGVPLILMAGSVKHIISSGGVMDTMLYYAAQPLSQAPPFLAAVIIYFLALFLELFVASAGAKAVLMMPILLPLADMVGVTRQTAVTAYCFGDGFSNLAYPTNPVLLIALGLAMVSYGKWMRWTIRFWFLVLGFTLFFLWLAVTIGFGRV